MFYLTGFESCLKNMISLLKTHEKRDLSTVSELKSAYINFLDSVQPDVWRPQIHFDDRIPILYDREKSKNLAKQYLKNDSILTDFDSECQIEVPNSREHIERALEGVKNALPDLKNIDPLLFELFNLVINTVFYAKCSKFGGGTTSTAMGVIWCAPRVKWIHNDYCEFLVHEMAHNLMFLDEVAFGHYGSIELMAKKENFAYSTILNIQRPLDKVIHSLVVGFEILKFREKVSYSDKNVHIHPNNERLKRNCRDTIESIRSVKNLEQIVTERFLWILNKVEQGLNELDSYKVELMA